jgi:hypothetical protein
LTGVKGGLDLIGEKCEVAALADFTGESDLKDAEGDFKFARLADLGETNTTL